MARLNRAMNRPPVRTHEGGKAYPHLKPIDQLRRSVLASLLWEGTFYEDGQSVASRIKDGVTAIGEKGLGQAGHIKRLQELRDLIIDARTKYKLRHVPLLMTAVFADVAKGTSHLTRDLVSEVIRRPDELGEILALYAHVHGEKPSELKKILPHGLKRGVAEAFGNFDEYQFTKWAKRDAAVSVRDAMFLTHPAAKEGSRKWNNKEGRWQFVDDRLTRPGLYAKIAADDLGSADTWEAGLSTVGQDKSLDQTAAKRETFVRLLSEGKMGYMALLRNLRKMNEVGVPHDLIDKAIIARKGAHSVLPFRFITAVNHAPMFASSLDKAMQVAVAQFAQFRGQTVVLVDVSGSMAWDKVSKNSELTRADAAAALASMVSGEKIRLVVFSSTAMEIPHFTGLSGVNTIKSAPIYNGGTHLGEALRTCNEIGGDRLIVISDEQSADEIGQHTTFTHRYMINVGSYENGVGYGKGWTANITGWSEQVLRYIHELEGEFDHVRW